jgi:hypothetical protein
MVIYGEAGDVQKALEEPPRRRCSMKRRLLVAVLAMTMLVAGASSAAADIQPTMTINYRLQPPQGNVTVITLYGTVSGDVGSPLVAFTGAVAGQTMTDPQGNYEVTLMGTSPGTVTGTIHDRQGRPFTFQAVLAEHQLTVTEFSASTYSGQAWLLAGRVQGDPIAGVVVRFSSSGVPSLNGRTATVLSDGSFALLVSLGRVRTASPTPRPSTTGTSPQRPSRPWSSSSSSPRQPAR